MKNLKTIPDNARSSRSGFGFVEVIVVISVIGVLSSIAIPALSGVFGRAEVARAIRNARILVSTFNSARAAGNITNYADAEEVIAAITTSPGITGRGVYATIVFYVPMAEPEITEAASLIAPALSGITTDGVLMILP